MSDREHSRKLTLTPAEAASLLRELADKLQSGTLKVGADEAAPSGDLKVKVSAKSKEGSASLEVKFGWRSTGTGGVASPQPLQRKGKSGGQGRIPPYKDIKKRMSSTFKKIRAHLREGSLPGLDLAIPFDEDAELMLHFPKKGEAADIKAFRAISTAFLAAVNAGDFEVVKREVAALAAAEKSCHKQYK